jgi:hypothetical protein
MREKPLWNKMCLYQDEDFREESRQAGKKMSVLVMNELYNKCNLILLQNSVLHHYSTSKDFHPTSATTLETNAMNKHWGTMAKRGVETGYLKSRGQGNKLHKTNRFIEKDHDKFLGTVSALTVKEVSLLVNEAIEDFMKKITCWPTFRFIYRKAANW